MLVLVGTLFSISLISFLLVMSTGDPQVAAVLSEDGAMDGLGALRQLELSQRLRLDLPWIVNTDPEDRPRRTRRVLERVVDVFTELPAPIDRTPTELTVRLLRSWTASAMEPPKDPGELGERLDLNEDERARLGEWMRAVVRAWGGLAAHFRLGDAAWIDLEIVLPEVRFTNESLGVVLATAGVGSASEVPDVAVLSSLARQRRERATPVLVAEVYDRWLVSARSARSIEDLSSAVPEAAALGSLLLPHLVAHLPHESDGLLLITLIWLARHADWAIEPALVGELVEGRLPLTTERRRRLLESVADRWERDALAYRVLSRTERVVVAVTETRYARWLGDIVRWDFGTSFVSERPVSRLIADRLPLTLAIQASALLLTLAIGIPLGALSAAQRQRPILRAMDVLLAASAAVPTFVLGAALVVGLAGVYPVHGLRSAPVEAALRANTLDWWDLFVLADLLAHLALPVTLSALGSVALIARQVRSGVLETLREEFVFAARSRGASTYALYRHHVLRVGLLPLVTLIGLSLPTLVAGSVVIETLFDLPGLGRLAFEAALARDVPVAMALVVLGSIVTVVGYACAEGALFVLDPRVRESGS